MLMLLFAFQIATDLFRRWWWRPVLAAIRVSAKTSRPE
jgi:hypothetical protein